MGVEYEDSESEHGDTDEEAVDDEQSVHDSEGTVDETVDEEMDADDGDDVSEKDDGDDVSENDDDDDTEEEEDTFHLLYLINDIGAIHEYCMGLRKEYRKALKQLNNLDEYDREQVIKSYAKLEVSVKDEQQGIENENDNCNKDDFWDFVFEFRDVLDEDTKQLDNYVAVEKERKLREKDHDEVPGELHEIIKSVLDLKKNFHNHGEECFETCSNAHIYSVGDFLKFAEEEPVNIRNYNPAKYDLIRKLTDPYTKSMGKLADSTVSFHEKRKTMQKTHVGESVLDFITNVIFPYLKSLA